MPFIETNTISGSDRALGIAFCCEHFKYHKRIYILMYFWKYEVVLNLFKINKTVWK